MFNNYISISKYLSYLFFLLPLSLVTGPLLSDLIVSTIAIVFIFIIYKEIDISYIKDKKVILFIVFWIYLTIRAFFSTNTLESLIPSFFYFRFGLFVLATVYFIKKIPNFEKNFTKFLFFTILFVSADAYFQIIFGYNFLGFENKVADRVSGLFGDEYILGSYLVRLCPLLLALIIDKIEFNIKNTISLFLFFCFYNLLVFYTAERTAFILNLVFLGLLIIIVKKIRFKLLSILLISIIPIFVAIKSDKSLYERMVLQTYNEVFKDNKIRIFTEGHQNHIKSALKMFKDNKLFGHGVKNYRVLCREPKYFEKITSCSTHPHNTFSQLLAETGLFGFFFVFSIFVFVCKEILMSIIKSFTKEKIDNQKAIISILIFINLFPFSPSGSFFNNWLSIVYFLPLGFYISRFKR